MLQPGASAWAQWSLKCHNRIKIKKSSDILKIVLHLYSEAEYRHILSSQPLVSLCNCKSVHRQPHTRAHTHLVYLHFVCVCVHCLGWYQPCLSHHLCIEDYEWPITSLLSLINEDNELPLLPTKLWCSSAGTEQREGCLMMCGRVCVCEGQREGRHSVLYVSKGGYTVHKR